jgi:hypothetical protein
MSDNKFSGITDQIEGTAQTVQTEKPLPKSKNPAYGRVTLYLPLEVIAALKSGATLAGQDLSGFVESKLKND